MADSQDFEVYVLQRCGFGKYQKIVSSLLGIIFVSEGMELSILAILQPLLQKEWNIPLELQGFLGSILFTGMLIGSLAGGFIIDRIGRKSSIEYSSIFMFVLGIYSAYLNDMYSFIVVRGFFGFLVGFMIPIVPTLLSEITSSSTRGKIIACVNSSFSLGQLIACGLSYFILDGLSGGNWRILLLICSFPSLIVWVGSRLYLQESPRYEFTIGSPENGLKILNKIGKINDPYFQELTDDDLESIMKYFPSYLKMEKPKFSWREVKKLFQNNIFSRITTCLWILWFMLFYIGYGMVFILPFFLGSFKGKEGLANLFLTTLGEFISIIPVLIIIDNRWFGRRKSLIISSLIAALCCFLSFTTKDSTLLIFYLSSGRFFIKMTISIIYPFTTELYPTPIRSLGVSLSSAVARVASSLMPFITISLYDYYPQSPFFLFSLMALISAYSAYRIPFDTRGVYLDQSEIIDEKGVVYRLYEEEPNTNKQTYENIEQSDLKKESE